MKKILIGLSILLVVQLATAQNQEQKDPFKELEGTWKLDLSPANLEDDNFTELVIKEISPLGLKGSFYYSKLREGRVNINFDGVYFAFVTDDGSGDYNTTAIFKEGKLMGTTHSLGRDFLSVWTAVKVK
ncbi:MAG: hypothetical protein R8P61_15225 [Bacteroidia bacterium]|nr:hypothetical protein [Bacteroidia bacterium]